MPLSAQQYADLTGWVDQYTAQSALITSNMAAQIVLAFRVIDDWDNSDQTLAAAILAARISEAGQQNAAGLSAQYIALVAAIMLDRPQSPIRPGLLRFLFGRRGTTGFKVWSRIVHRYRQLIREGATDAEALEAMVEMIEVMAQMDTALAVRDSVDAQMQFEGITGYRRIIHPELSKGGTCGLCIAASTRVYKVGDLMPLHDRCKCTVLPIIVVDGETVDPGMSLNDSDLEQLLKQLYTDADSNSGRNQGNNLKRTRYKTVEHGELGPYLVRAGGTPDSADDHVLSAV